MKIAMIRDIGLALEIYYSMPVIGNQEIGKLLGTQTYSVISRYKKKALEQMEKDNVPLWDAHTVDTESAFKAWGLDIKNLELRYKKLQALRGTNSHG